MKDMSNRDKMIIIILTIVVILVAGFFALIRPKYQQLVADTLVFEETEKEWQEIDTKLKAIPGLKDTITKVYNDSNDTAKIFVNEVFADVNKNYSDEKLNYAVDQHIQPAIDDSSLMVTELEIKGATASTVTYYYYTPNVVTYSLLEAADVNGNYAEEITDRLMTSTVLSERATAEVVTNTVSVTVRGEKENLMTFLDAIKADSNAILVESISIKDYTFCGGLDEEEQNIPVVQAPVEPEVDEDGNPIEAEPVQTPVVNVPSAGAEMGEGYSELSIDVTFYNAKPIDKPDLGD